MAVPSGSGLVQPAGAPPQKDERRVAYRKSFLPPSAASAHKLDLRAKRTGPNTLACCIYPLDTRSESLRARRTHDLDHNQAVAEVRQKTRQEARCCFLAHQEL